MAGASLAYDGSFTYILAACTDPAAKFAGFVAVVTGEASPAGAKGRGLSVAALTG